MPTKMHQGTNWRETIKDAVLKDKQTVRLLAEYFDISASFIDNMRKLKDSLDNFQPEGDVLEVQAVNDYKQLLDNLLEAESKLDIAEVINNNQTPEEASKQLSEKIGSDDFTQFMQAQSKLVVNQSLVSKAFQKLDNADRFKKKFATARKSDESRSTQLSSYTIMPVQQGPRYLLLFRDIAKNAGKENLKRIKTNAESNLGILKTKVDAINEAQNVLEDKPGTYWQNNLNEDSITKKKSVNPISELLNNEADFVNNMKTLQKELKKFKPEGRKSHIKIINNFQQQLDELLSAEKKLGLRDIAAIKSSPESCIKLINEKFNSYEFKDYIAKQGSLASSYVETMKTFDKLDNGKDFKQQFTQNRQNDKASDLNAYLSQPFQRMMRYGLTATEIEKCAKKDNMPSEIQNCASEMKDVAKNHAQEENKKFKSFQDRAKKIGNKLGQKIDKTREKMDYILHNPNKAGKIIKKDAKRISEHINKGRKSVKKGAKSAFKAFKSKIKNFKSTCNTGRSNQKDTEKEETKSTNLSN